MIKILDDWRVQNNELLCINYWRIYFHISLSNWFWIKLSKNLRNSLHLIFLARDRPQLLQIDNLENIVTSHAFFYFIADFIWRRKIKVKILSTSTKNQTSDTNALLAEN